MTTSAKRARAPQHPEELRQGYDAMVRAAGVRSRIVRTQSARIHVIEGGEGPAVLHLHGNNTSSLSHLMLLEHTGGVHSYLVDRPGSGLSDPDPFPRDEFRQRAVAFVDDVLDELDLASAVIVGASGGGTWAFWYALARPDRVRGLVMLGSVPLLPGARIPFGIRLVATPLLGSMISRAVRPNRRMLLGLMRSVGEGDSILRHPDLLDSLVDAARDQVAAAANVAELQALLSPLGPRRASRIRPEELRGLAAPTLMIWGDRDPVVRLADARKVADLIPDAHLEVLPAGHVPQLGNPERVAGLVEGFARRCAPDPPRPGRGGGHE